VRLFDYGLAAAGMRTGAYIIVSRVHQRCTHEALLTIGYDRGSHFHKKDHKKKKDAGRGGGAL